MKPQLDALRRDADAHLTEAPPGLLEGDYEERAGRIQDPFLARIVVFAFLAVVTEEAPYLAAARRWTLALARMPRLAGEIDGDTGTCTGCGYGEGWALVALAVAYDWLHPRWSRAERALLSKKIQRYTAALHHAAAGGEWWSGAYLHHDTWIPLGGMGLGAMSVLDEAADAKAWAARALQGLDEALSWLDSDGAWPEGPCGWAFALASVTPFWDAYRRRYPERGRTLLDNPWLTRTWRFRLASRTPDGRFLGFGDCRDSGGYQTTGYQGAAVLRWLAARYRNPHAQWLAAREWEDRPNPYTAAWEILWADPSVEEAPPGAALLGSLFENQAMAFVRTSFERSATVLAFRATGLLGRRATALFAADRLAQFNNSITHTHADGNTFAIWSRGEFAVTLAHYGQRQTSFQNSLLVDGQGQYVAYGADHPGRPTGRVTAFFSSPAGAYVEGEASRCYPPALLRRFARRLFLVPPGVVFLLDDVVAEAPAALEWRLHVDRSAAVELGADGFTSVSGEARTTVRIAAPAGMRVDELTDAYNRAVVLARPGRAAEGRLVLAVLPSMPAGAPGTVSAPTPASFVIEALGAQVLAAFARAPGAIEVPGLLAGEGLAGIAWRRGEERGLLAAASTRLSVGGERLFEASIPVTASYVGTGGSGILTVDAPEPATVVVAAGGGRWIRVRVKSGASTHEI